MRPNVPLWSSFLSCLRHRGNFTELARIMTFCSAQSARFQKTTPGCFSFMVRSGRRPRSPEALGQALLPDKSSFLFAPSEYRFMGAAFSLSARPATFLFTTEHK